MAARRTRRARKGFSLAETLVAVLILGLLSSAAALGVSQALWQRNKSIALADAQTVASTAAQIVTDQIRYGRIASVESDGAMILASGVYQTPVCISLDEDGYLTTQGVTATPGGGLSRGRAYALLGQDAYCGLHLSDLAFTLHESGDTVESVDVKLSVAQTGETQSLWDLEFSVAPVNPQRFTVE